MTTLCKFVDAISATPTVRFDFNSGACSLQRQGTMIGPAPLNRAVAANAMRDGGLVSSSSYGLRTITLVTLFNGSDTDAVFAQMQLLMRELDRVENFLMWHPDGEPRPVFFKTFRSTPDLLDMSQQAVGVWKVTATILAETFALGLRETIGPFTVNNDPLSGSNPCSYALPTILGDVAAPLNLSSDSTVLNGRQPFVSVAAYTGTAPSSPYVLQTTALTAGTDCSAENAGDPDMSGGTYRRISFATDTSLTLRGTIAVSPPRVGSYKVLVRVRRSVTSTVFALRFGLKDVLAGGVVSYTSPSPVNGLGPHWVDLGTFAFPAGNTNVPAGSVPGATLAELEVGRTSGTGHLDVDCFMLVPVGGPEVVAATSSTVSAAMMSPGETIYLDSEVDRVYFLNGSTAPAQVAGIPRTGGLPFVHPSRANFMHWLSYLGHAGYLGLSALNDSLTSSTVLTGTYHPRYLFVRPSAS